jgi:hypothetical protein
MDASDDAYTVIRRRATEKKYRIYAPEFLERPTDRGEASRALSEFIEMGYTCQRPHSISPQASAPSS